MQKHQREKKTPVCGSYLTKGTINGQKVLFINCNISNFQYNYHPLFVSIFITNAELWSCPATKHYKFNTFDKNI